MKRSVLISLILMGVSNFTFALLAQAGHTNWGLAGAIGFENFASGIGGVTVVAYFSALCDLRFTASQYALISAAASIVGRFVTGTSAGALVEGMGYVNFYLLTTRRRAAGDPPVLVDDARRAGRQLDRHRRGRRRGRRAQTTASLSRAATRWAKQLRRRGRASRRRGRAPALSIARERVRRGRHGRGREAHALAPWRRARRGRGMS